MKKETAPKQPCSLMCALAQCGVKTEPSLTLFFGYILTPRGATLHIFEAAFLRVSGLSTAASMTPVVV